MPKNLALYNIIIAIDKSGSMSNSGVHAATRWLEAQETTIALATKAASFDADGITVIPFANTLKIYDNVTPATVEQVFQENEPNGGTDTALVLKTVFDRYTAEKTAGAAKPVILIVITDGAPNDQNAVKAEIKAFAETLAPNEAGDDTDEFGILFVQIGNDTGATQFLKDLDDNLGAKFDIVDTKTSDELEAITLTEALLQALEG